MWSPESTHRVGFQVTRMQSANAVAHLLQVIFVETMVVTEKIPDEEGAIC